MIQEIIKFLRKNTQYKFHFQSADVSELSDGDVVYDFSNPTSNGIKQTQRLTLMVITKGTGENSVLKSEEIAKNINDKILTKGDNPLTKNILSCVLNGGGIIENKATDTLHNTMYFDIIFR